jgi:osmotically-inducible protein OsmY
MMQKVMVLYRYQWGKTTTINLNFYGDEKMKQFKIAVSFILAAAFVIMLGCASTASKEGTGEYIDDAVITTKVKAAILNEETLKSAEVNVETFKGVVQLSGFVNSEADIAKAAAVASGVKGVTSVKNDMRLKSK